MADANAVFNEIWALFIFISNEVVMVKAVVVVVVMNSDD